MPWCPKCKNEYRAGITVCVDCKVELVESLDEMKNQEITMLLMKADQQQDEVAMRFAAFLDYSGIINRIENNEDGTVDVFIRKEDTKEAKRCMMAFYAGESERLQKQTEEKVAQALDELTDEQDKEELQQEIEKRLERVKAFKSAADRYEDYRSSASSFLVLGFIGIIFSVLCLMKVIDFLNPFTAIVILAMFAGFFIIGVSCFQKLKPLEKEMNAEKELLAKVDAWMSENITNETIESFRAVPKDKTAEDLGVDDINYQNMVYMYTLENIKQAVGKEFDMLHPQQLDDIVNRYYEKHFEE